MLSTRLETQGFTTDSGFTLPTLNTDRQQIEDSNLTRISTQVKRFDDFFNSNLGHLSEKSLKHIDYDNLDVLNYVAQNSQSSIYTDDQRGLLVSLRKSSNDSRVSEIKLTQETAVSPRGLVDSHFVSPRGSRDPVTNRATSTNVTIEPIKNIHMIGKEAKGIKFDSPKKGVEIPLSTRVISLPNENVLIETSKLKPSLFSKAKKNSDSGDLIPILKNNNKRENISITISGSGGDQTTRTLSRKQTIPSPTNTIFSPTNAEEPKTRKGNKVEFLVDEIIQSPKVAVTETKVLKSASLQKNEKEILNVYTRRSSPKAEDAKQKLRSFHQSIGSAEDLQKNNPAGKMRLPDAVTQKTQWKKLKGIRKPESFSGGLSSQKVQLPNLKTETGGSGEIPKGPEPTSAKSNLTLGEETEKEKDQKSKVMIRNLRVDATNHTSPREQRQQSSASTRQSLDDKSSTLKSGKKESNDFNSATSISKKFKPQLNLSGTSSPASESIKSARIVGQIQSERVKTVPDHFETPNKKKVVNLKKNNTPGGSLRKLKSSITEKNNEEEFSQSFSRAFEDRDDSIIIQGGNIKVKKGVAIHALDDNEMWPSAIAVEDRADPEDDLNLFEKKKSLLNLNFHKKKNLIKHNKGAASPKTFPTEAFFAREMQSNHHEKDFVRDFGETIKLITKNIMILGSRGHEQLTSISKISFPIGTRKLSEPVNISQFDYLLKQDTVEEKEGQRSPLGDIARLMKLGTLETQGTLPMERQGSGSGSNNEIPAGGGSQPAIEKEIGNSLTKSKTHTVKNWVITVNINPPIEEASPQMEESVLPYASLISPGDMSEIMTERRRDQLEEGSMTSITKSKQYKFEMSTRKPIEETPEEENPFSEHYESDPHVGNEQLSFRKTIENIFKFNDVDLDKVESFGSRGFLQRIKANFFSFVEGFMSNPVTKKAHMDDLEASYFENMKRSAINTLQKLFKFCPKTRDAVFSFIDQAILIPQEIILSSIAEEEALSAGLDPDDSRYDIPLKVKGSMKVPIYELQPNSAIYNRITGMPSITVLCCMDANMIQQAQSIQPFMQMYLCSSTPSLAYMDGNYAAINRIFGSTSDKNWEFVSKIIHGLYGELLHGPLESKIELLESNSSFVKFKGDKAEEVIEILCFLKIIIHIGINQN